MAEKHTVDDFVEHVRVAFNAGEFKKLLDGLLSI
jgi:hypothetical protein